MAFFGPFGTCMQFMFGKTSLASSFQFLKKLVGYQLLIYFQSQNDVVDIPLLQKLFLLQLGEQF